MYNGATPNLPPNPITAFTRIDRIDITCKHETDPQIANMIEHAHHVKLKKLGHPNIQKRFLCPTP
jgi:hypothetical protein